MDEAEGADGCHAANPRNHRQEVRRGGIAAQSQRLYLRAQLLRGRLGQNAAVSGLELVADSLVGYVLFYQDGCKITDEKIGVLANLQWPDLQKLSLCKYKLTSEDENKITAAGLKKLLAN